MTGQLHEMFAQRPEKEDDDHYFEAELTPGQRNALIALLTGKKKHTQLGKKYREKLLEALILSRRKEGELIRAILDWDEVEKRSKEQDIPWADVLFDLMARKDKESS